MGGQQPSATGVAGNTAKHEEQPPGAASHPSIAPSDIPAFPRPSLADELADRIVRPGQFTLGRLFLYVTLTAVCLGMLNAARAARPIVIVYGVYIVVLVAVIRRGRRHLGCLSLVLLGFIAALITMVVCAIVVSIVW